MRLQRIANGKVHLFLLHEDLQDFAWQRMPTAAGHCLRASLACFLNVYLDRVR
jgi:hypothetical protein